MTEPTVQVPVSLLRELHDTLGFHVGYEHDLTQHVGDLLSQPTTTVGTAHIPDDADQLRCAHCGRFARETGCDSEHEPTRIEDMAPGTTFTAAYRYGDDPVRFIAETPRMVRAQLTGVPWRPRDIDPSTIRGVTPPAGV